MKRSSRGDIWKGTLALLASISEEGFYREIPAPPRRSSRNAPKTQRKLMELSSEAHLDIVDYSFGKIIVSFRDATAGQYVEQVWMLKKATRSGKCVLTGEKIRRGDDVYGPYIRAYKPLNYDWMFLASVVVFQDDKYSEFECRNIIMPN
jgi:hypothetical protein